MYSDNRVEVRLRPGKIGAHVGAQIRLGQHHDRLRTSVAGLHQVAIQPLEIVITVESLCDQDIIQICGNNLCLAFPARRLSGKTGPSRQNMADYGLCADHVYGSPVSNCREGFFIRFQKQFPCDGSFNVSLSGLYSK
jgi:hypothetical protein